MPVAAIYLVSIQKLSPISARNVPPLPVETTSSEEGLTTSGAEQSSPTSDELNFNIQSLPAIRGSRARSRDSFEIASTSKDQGQIVGGETRPSLTISGSLARDLDVGRQLKGVYTPTMSPESLEQGGSRRTNFKEPTTITKRSIGALNQVKGSRLKGNKRTRVAHVGSKGSKRLPVLKESGENLTISSEISRTMPLSDAVPLLIQHGCQDLTQTLDLSACSEYPISSGGFGDIFRGKLNDNAPVAIKCMRIVIDPYSNEHEKYLKCTAREIHTWSKLDHRYVLRLSGLAQFRGQIAMVSPWAEHGALPEFLARQPQHNRPRLCAQIAEGLDFLHKQKIVHGDLKGANILISENYEPLLTDFGNATLHDRSLQFTCTTAKSSFSLRWTAPELLHEEPSSFEADVYALGMTTLEVMTGKVPYAGMKDMAVINAINSKQHPKRPEEHIPTSAWGDTLWLLLSRCWAFEPEARPSARNVQHLMEMVDPERLIPSERKISTSGRADTT
ncbi:hypothetical protein FRC09_011280 [Ceratobasidium sp. 395]|nr:hypothetical protein FRC09_011280 [Ceratobasidium sp. 395]